VRVAVTLVELAFWVDAETRAIVVRQARRLRGGAPMVTVPPTATYSRGLETMELAKALTDNDRMLLRTLYGGADYSLTTRDIGHEMGWTSRGSVNAHFGRRVQRLMQRMQCEIPDGLPQITAVATF